MRSFFLTAVVALSISAWGQEGPANITLEQRATTLGMLVDKLAEQTKKPLAVSPELRGDVYILWLHDAPVQDVLDRIANASCAKWVNDKDGKTRLIPNNALMREIAAKQLKAETARVRKLIDDFVANKPDDGGPDMEMGEEVTPTEAPEPPAQAEVKQKADAKAAAPQAEPLPSDPDNDLMRVLVGQISAEKLAGMLGNTRLVYAYPATTVQFSFGNIGRAVQDWTERNNKLAKALEDLKAKNPQPPDQTEKPEFMRIIEQAFNDRVERKATAQLPAKVTLGIVKGGTGIMRFVGTGGYSLEMKVFDNKGDILTKSSTQIGGINWSDNFEIDPATGRPAPKKVEVKRPDWVKDEPVTTSDDTKEFTKISDMTDPVALMTYKPNEEFAKKFADPVNFDPLGYATTDELFAFAKVHSLQLVANVPDNLGTDAMAMFGTGGKAAVKTAAVYDRYLRSDAINLVKTDSWMTIQPKDVAADRAIRLDRFALRKLIEAAQAKEIPGLDDAADYAAANEPPSSTPIVNPYMFFFSPNLMDMMPMKIGDWNVLRVYGLLSPSQRDALKRGDRVMFGTMMSAQQAATRTLLFSPEAKLLTQADADARKKLEESNPMFTFMSMWMPAMGRDYKTDPTEVMPGGLPMQGWIQGSVVDEMMVTISSSESKNDELKMLGAIGASELAAIQSFLQMAQDEMPAIPKLDRFRPGRRMVLTLKFNVATDVFLSDKLVENRLPKNTKAVPYDQLPSEFREIVDRAAKKMEKDMADMKSMRQRGNDKP